MQQRNYTRNSNCSRRIHLCRGDYIHCSLRCDAPFPAGAAGLRSSFAKDPRVYQRGAAEPEWLRLTPDSDDLVLPDLTSASERELAELRDSVKYEGLLAYYVAMSLTSVGTE